MHYVWQHRLWGSADMCSTTGECVEVLDPGILNTDAGPDFFNAKVRIGSHTWAGNVEMHLRASDWHRHGHDDDPAYGNVVLHVVRDSDTHIRRADGQVIPQVVMPCTDRFEEIYRTLVDKPVSGLSCADIIADTPPVYITDWITALGFERLFDKSARATRLAAGFSGDWSQVIYVMLGRALGFNTNSDPFERLVLRLPLKILLKHRTSLPAIEGALFGQAGLLADLPAAVQADPYVRQLVSEHAFVRHKYSLPEPVYLGWRMARMRPQGFPQRRIALLAAMISRDFDIGYEMLNVRTIEQARELFRIRLGGYWAAHYTFGTPSGSAPAVLSQSSIDSLVINVVAPVLHAYGTAMSAPVLTERAVELLQAIAPENNVVTRLFAASGIRSTDAFTTQALIHLRRHYCEPRKCLYCRLGHRYFMHSSAR